MQKNNNQRKVDTKNATQDYFMISSKKSLTTTNNRAIAAKKGSAVEPISPSPFKNINGNMQKSRASFGGPLSGSGTLSGDRVNS